MGAAELDFEALDAQLEAAERDLDHDRYAAASPSETSSCTRTP